MGTLTKEQILRLEKKLPNNWRIKGFDINNMIADYLYQLNSKLNFAAIYYSGNIVEVDNNGVFVTNTYKGDIANTNNFLYPSDFERLLEFDAYIVKEEYTTYAENLLKNEGLGYLTILETESNKKFNFVKNSPQYEFFKLKMKVLDIWFEPIYF